MKLVLVFILSLPMVACLNDSSNNNADINKAIIGFWEGKCQSEGSSSYDTALEFEKGGTGGAFSTDYKNSTDCTGETFDDGKPEVFSYEIGSKVTATNGTGYEINVIYPGSDGEPEEIIYGLVRIETEQGETVMYLDKPTNELDGWSEDARPDTFKSKPSYTLVE